MRVFKDIRLYILMALLAAVAFVGNNAKAQVAVPSDFFGNQIASPIHPAFTYPTYAATSTYPTHVPYSIQHVRMWQEYGCPTPADCNSGNNYNYGYLWWSQLNPTKGVYNFKLFDSILTRYKREGMEDVIYTIVRTPLWATANRVGGSVSTGGNSANLAPDSMVYLKRFLDTLLREATKLNFPIKFVECWNEPEAGSYYWQEPDDTTGWGRLVDIAQTIYTTAKAYDPSITVLSPAAQGSGADYWLSKFLSCRPAQAKNTFDVMAYHGYINFYNGGTQEKVERLIDKLITLKSTYGISNKPLWDTEGFDAFSAGVQVASPYTLAKGDTQSAYLAQRYLISAAKGVKRVYWYDVIANNGKMVNGSSITHNSGTFVPNEIMVADAVVQSWLTGATVSNFVISGSVYSVDITKSGTTNRAVWVNSGLVSYATTYSSYETVYGTTGTVSGGVVTVGRKPILLKSPDVTAPVPGGSGVISASATTASSTTLSWAKATDAVTTQAQLNYTVVRSTSNALSTLTNAIDAGVVSGSGTDISGLTVTGLQSATAYNLNVIVSDAAGNQAIYTPVSVTTTGDATVPTVGTAPVASNIGTTSLTLSWGAASDNVTASSLLIAKVYRSSSANMGTVANAESNGTLVASGTGITTATITGLTAATTYYFTVVVADAAGNKSVYSTTSATTATLDATAPVPGGSGSITACCAYASSFSASWAAATDNSTAPTQLVYTVYTSLYNNISTVSDAQTYGKVAATGAGLTSAAISGLTSGSTYYITVVVSDQSGNKSRYNTTTFSTVSVYLKNGRKKR